jgi:hypothetical protein
MYNVVTEMTSILPNLDIFVELVWVPVYWSPILNNLTNDGFE